MSGEAGGRTVGGGSVIGTHLPEYLDRQLGQFRSRLEALLAQQASLPQADGSGRHAGEATDRTGFLDAVRKMVIAPVQTVLAAPRTSTSTPRTSRTPTPQQLLREPLIATAEAAAAAASAAAAATEPPPLLPLLPTLPTLPGTLRMGSAGGTTLSLELALLLIHEAKRAMTQIDDFQSGTLDPGRSTQLHSELIFVTLLQALMDRHIEPSLRVEIKQLVHSEPCTSDQATSPLSRFMEVVHLADLIQQMLDVFYTEEIGSQIDQSDFLNPAVKEKKRFEQKLDQLVADGLNRVIDVLISTVEHIFTEKQLPGDFNPPPQEKVELRPTVAAVEAVACLDRHTRLLIEMTEKIFLDVFFQEVGIRFFHLICKHIKRYKISMDGGLVLISDVNYFNKFAESLRQRTIMPFYVALKEVANIYIVSPDDSQSIAALVNDNNRYIGIFQPDEVYEFAACRNDWLKVKKVVDKMVYGLGRDDCRLM